MAVNKVVYDGETLIDLTSDSVTPKTLARGTTAHDASGNVINGEMVVPTITLSQGQEPDGRGNVTISVISEVDGETIIEEAKVVDGNKGADGKSAYQYAKDGGYTGTEAEFAKKLATPLVTPQMFGAVCDGDTNDTKAIQDMFDSVTDGCIVYFPKGKYIVQHTDTVNGGDYVAVLVDGKRGIKVIFDNGATIKHKLTTVGRYTMFCAHIK